MGLHIHRRPQETSSVVMATWCSFGTDGNLSPSTMFISSQLPVTPLQKIQTWFLRARSLMYITPGDTHRSYTPGSNKNQSFLNFFKIKQS